MTDRNADSFSEGVMFHADRIENVADLAFVWSEVVKLFTSSGNTAPPMPKDMITFPPCKLLVTDRHRIGTGERTGRVQFSRLDGSSCSDETWQIRPGDKPRTLYQP